LPLPPAYVLASGDRCLRIIGNRMFGDLQRAPGPICAKRAWLDDEHFNTERLDFFRERLRHAFDREFRGVVGAHARESASPPIDEIFTMLPRRRFLIPGSTA